MKFPGLPVGYWSTEVLSKMASAVGKQLYTDKFTEKSEQIAYARTVIEVDISQPLPEMITVETPTEPWDQPVTYDLVPKFCNNCVMCGHEDHECWYNKDAEAEPVQQGKRGVTKNRRKCNRRRKTKQVWISTP